MAYYIRLNSITSTLFAKKVCDLLDLSRHVEIEQVCDVATDFFCRKHVLNKIDAMEFENDKCRLFSERPKEKQLRVMQK